MQGPAMTSETITKPASTGVAFPKAEVQAKLGELLLAAAQSDAALKGIALPSNAAGQVSASVQLDSLEVVSLLCDIEPIVNFELKDSLVRSGGYSSIHQAIEHLMPRIDKAWQKHGTKK
jgi:hypothetical protein